LRRTFAGFALMHVMLAPLSVSNMRLWEWSIAVFAPMPAGRAQRLVRGWLRDQDQMLWSDVDYAYN